MYARHTSLKKSKVRTGSKPSISHLQPIHIAQNVGVPKGLHAFKSCLGQQCLVLCPRCHLKHKHWHRFTCGLKRGKKVLLSFRHYFQMASLLTTVFKMTKKGKFADSVVQRHELLSTDYLWTDNLETFKNQFRHLPCTPLSCMVSPCANYTRSFSTSGKHKIKGLL